MQSTGLIDRRLHRSAGSREMERYYKDKCLCEYTHANRLISVIFNPAISSSQKANTDVTSMHLNTAFYPRDITWYIFSGRVSVRPSFRLSQAGTVPSYRIQRYVCALYKRRAIKIDG